MASLLNFLLVLTTTLGTVKVLKADCSSSLGMKNKKIANKQITASHWLYFKRELSNDHYQPQLARLDMKSSTGAWCSDSIAENKDQYIQIDLTVDTKVTGIATQGRYAELEYTEAYQITYQRNKERRFRKLREDNIWKEFKGNSDNQHTVQNKFRHPIIARKLRIYPRGSEFAIYCLRLELYGCKWSHRESDIVSYTAPLGSLLNGVDTRDYDTYDGNISKTLNTISGGLGKLTDDIYGSNRRGTNWVAYNVHNPTITFEFHKKRLVTKIIVHVKNNGNAIHIFRHVLISIGTSNGNYSLIKKYISNRKQTNKLGAFTIGVDLGEKVLAKRIRLQFVKRQEWLLISEIVFISDDYPPKPLFPLHTVQSTPSTVKYHTQLPSSVEEAVVSDSARTKMGESSKGLSFPIILTITLVTSALFIILTVVIYKTYVNKKTSHLNEPHSRGSSPQVPTLDKQQVSLLCEQPRMNFHPNTLLQHGMYMQSTPQPYNANGLIS